MFIRIGKVIKKHSCINEIIKECCEGWEKKHLVEGWPCLDSVPLTPCDHSITLSMTATAGQSVIYRGIRSKHFPSSIVVTFSSSPIIKMFWQTHFIVCCVLALKSPSLRLVKLKKHLSISCNSHIFMSLHWLL